MAIGRISGPLLRANLVRNGIDLAFETDLLYLDVQNSRIGIKTDSPAYSLHVQGDAYTQSLETIQAQISDVVINSNLITTSIGNLQISPATVNNRVLIGPAQIPDIYSDVLFHAPDNRASAFEISENGNLYVRVVTTDTNEQVVFGATPVVAVQNTTNSTSSTSGALTVAGGVGVGGNLYVQGNITAADAEFASLNNTAIGNVVASTGEFTQIIVDDLLIDNNAITSLSTNANIVLSPNGIGVVDVSNSVIANVSTPVQDADAANKLYVDTQIDTVSLQTLGETGQELVNLVDDDLRFRSGINAGVAVDVVRGTLAEANIVNVTVSLDQDLSKLGTPSFIGVTAGAVSVAGNSITADENSNLSLIVTNGVVSTTNLQVSDLTLNRVVFAGASGRLQDSPGFVFTPSNGTGTLAITGAASIDNITIDGNVISATNTQGNIVLLPAAGGYIAASNAQIKEVAMPIEQLDAANKEYVDFVARGLNATKPAFALVDTALDATYAPDGYDIDWATLESNTNGAFPTTDTVDSSVLNVIDAIVLITAQTNAAHNGLYEIETPGDSTTPWKLRRSEACRTSEQVPGTFVFVKLGSTYQNTGWVAIVTDITTFEIDVDSINWVQVSGVGTYLAGDALSLDANIFNVNVDDLSIEIVNDALQVKQSGITNDMLFNDFFTISADLGTPNPVVLGETLTLTSGSGIITTVADNEITIAGTDADYIAKGVASFDIDNFQVTTGAVSANPIVLGTATLDLGSTVLVVDGMARVSSGNVRIEGNSITTTNLNGNLILSPNGNGVVDAASSLISNVTNPQSDQDAATKIYVDDRIEELSELELAADTGIAQAVSLVNDTLLLTGGTGVETVVTRNGLAVDVAFSIGQPVETNSTVTFATVTSSQLTVNGTATVAGDLVVTGTTTTLDTVNLQVEDPLIKLARNNISDTMSIGFYGQYDSGAGALRTGMFRSHTNGEYYLFENYNSDISSNVVDTAGIQLAKLNVDSVSANNIEGVIDGGTY